jgi:hypothetical protein
MIKSIFTVSVDYTYTPEQTVVTESDKSLFDSYLEKKPIIPYTPSEEYRLYINRMFPNDSSCSSSTRILTNVTHVAYKCIQWTNDRYKPLDTYSESAHLHGLIPKPVSTSTLKTDVEYNPRLSHGRMMNTFPILFERQQYVNPYPRPSTGEFSTMQLQSIRIPLDDDLVELPPTITLQWNRLARYTNTHVFPTQSVDCIMDSNGLYLPCNAMRISISDVEHPSICDSWTFEDCIFPSTTQIQFTFRMD